MKPIRAYLAIWNKEDQSFVELFVARVENKTHVQPFQSDEKLKYKERITWTGNFTDLLFSFIMKNISFEDHREFYLLVCFKESYKAVFVFTSSYLEVQATTQLPTHGELSDEPHPNTGLMGLTSIPPTQTRNIERGGFSSLKVNPKLSDKDNPTHSTKADRVALISAVTSSVVVIIIAIIVIIIAFYCKVWKLKEQQGRNLQERRRDVVVEFISAPEEHTEADDNKSTDSNFLHETETAPALVPRAPRSYSWEFPKEKLEVLEIFGQGAFGQVAKGLAFEIAGKVGWTVVAIKMLKDDAWESDRQDLLSELSIMKKLPHHRHVVKLLGCVTTSAYPLVIVEFASHGDLLGYLLKSRGLPDTYYQTTGKLTRVTAKKMMMFAWQIANGMNFLSQHKVVHRDLAARNVLVAEGNVCKITDFGMARQVRENEIYTMRAGGRVPAKWTAYEALLYGVYTTQSDVWSYGVVMYEIFTLGADPYAGIKTRDIADLLGRGFRMRRPKHVDKDLHAVMLSCWNEDPQQRPTFKSLQDTLEKIEKQQTGYINLQSFTEASYVNVDNARETEDEAIL
ncbi:proto-oncogene tyrosine-protein kinase receptor Ret-like [Oculina patagonica]